MPLRVNGPLDQMRREGSPRETRSATGTLAGLGAGLGAGRGDGRGVVMEGLLASTAAVFLALAILACLKSSGTNIFGP
jgi:hypothetical protein